MRPIALLFTTLLTAGVSLGTSATSVCDIMHPDKLDMKAIRITARILFTMHGAFLTTDSCPDHSYDIVVLYPNIEGTPPVAFSLGSDAIERLKTFFRPDGGTAAACAVLEGQAFYKKHFRSKPLGGGPLGNGFGPRGAFRVAFVIHSVEEIHVCK
jgi:hypothetical protein